MCHTISCNECNVGFAVSHVLSGGSSSFAVADVSVSPSSSMSSSLKPKPKACGMLAEAVLMQLSDNLFELSYSLHSRLVPL